MRGDNSFALPSSSFSVDCIALYARDSWMYVFCPETYGRSTTPWIPSLECPPPSLQSHLSETWALYLIAPFPSLPLMFSLLTNGPISHPWQTSKRSESYVGVLNSSYSFLYSRSRLSLKYVFTIPFLFYVLTALVWSFYVSQWLIISWLLSLPPVLFRSNPSRRGTNWPSSYYQNRVWDGNVGVLVEYTFNFE